MNWLQRQETRAQRERQVKRHAFRENVRRIHRRPFFEVLESRQLLAADIQNLTALSLTPADRTLIEIGGQAINETIVTQDGEVMHDETTDGTQMEALSFSSGSLKVFEFSGLTRYAMDHFRSADRSCVDSRPGS